MSSRRGRALGVLAVLLLLLGARGPLHVATHALPVSNDDAIPLLIARHVLKGELTTILWNQPYNGTLDAYLLAPGLLLAGPHTVFRLYEAAGGVLLIVAVGLLARRVEGEGAGWAAALLAAFGTPYMALMTATGPTPNFLVPLLVAFALLAGFRRLQPEAGAPSIATVSAGGLVCGLAIWNSVLALPALLGGAAGLFLAGLRPRLRSVAVFIMGLALGLAPLVVARAIGASGESPVTALRPRWLWADGLVDLASAAGGLLGLEVPLVVDGPERDALPPTLRLGLVLGLLTLLLAGAGSRRALPLLGWGAGVAAAFALGRRTGADEIRYLYGFVLPVFALAGAGLARVARRWPWAAAALALLTTVPWAFGHVRLVERWRDPDHAVRVWQVPPLEPALSTLERAGVRSAYASLQFAGRLTLESGGRVIASQAWNERIPGDPLRFRDEVDLDPRAAWVLSPHLSRGMPRADGFRALLAELGGSWREDRPGDLVVFRGFRPPYDESRPVPAGSLTVSVFEGPPLPGALLDRDARTAWTSPVGTTRGSGLTVRVHPPRRLSALLLAVDLDRSPLAAPWICEVEGAILSRGPARHGLQWVNGVPRAGKQALLVVPLNEAMGGEVRLIFQGAGPPLVVSEVFAYGPHEEPHPAAGAEAAANALEAARAGEWDEAVRLYAEAARLEPDRASHHAALARARWRASQRRWLDVESLDDGGPELVQAR